MPDTLNTHPRSSTFQLEFSDDSVVHAARVLTDGAASSDGRRFPFIYRGDVCFSSRPLTALQRNSLTFCEQKRQEKLAHARRDAGMERVVSIISRFRAEGLIA